MVEPSKLRNVLVMVELMAPFRAVVVVVVSIPSL